MPQLDATIKHLKEGVKGFTVAAAVKNIEGWETTLEPVDLPGVKALCKDLANLKKHLQADKVDAAQVKTIMAKLGTETVAIAGKMKEDNADKVQQIGTAITAMCKA